MEKLGEGDAGYIFRSQWRGMPVVAKVLKNPEQEHDFAHEVDAGYIFRSQWRGMPVVAKVLKNPKQEHNFAHQVAVLSRLPPSDLTQQDSTFAWCVIGP